MPYYGAKEHTAYFDHEFPTYAINDRIVLYDGRTIQATNGVCGWNLYGDAIAYREQPNGQGECIWYDGHDGHDFSLYYEPVLASADGVVVRSEDGELLLDLDGDGFEQTGWVLLYMHILTHERAEVGTVVAAGDRLGHPSCEGGIATGTHLHFARKYNGEWISADRSIPLNLDGWIASSETYPYDGYLTKDEQQVEACACRNDFNQISR